MNFQIAAILFVLLLTGLSRVCAFADEVRVLSCEIPFGRNAIAKTAEEILGENPDIILIQNARGWAHCASLAQALKPAEYSILACSSFGPPASGGTSREVAILSKLKGYYGWAERAGTNNPALGFALAAVQAGEKRLAVASLQAGKGTQAVHVAESVVRHWNLVSGWKTNKPAAFLALSSARSFARPQAMIREAFQTEGLTRVEPATSDSLAFVCPAGKALRLEPISTNSSFLLVSFDPDRIAPSVASKPKFRPRKAAAKTAAPASMLAAKEAPEAPSNLNLKPDPAPAPSQVAAATNFAIETPPVTSSNAAPAVMPPAESVPSLSSTNLSATQAKWLAAFIAFGTLSVVILVRLKGSRRSPRSRNLLSEGVVATADNPYVVVSPRSSTASGSDGEPSVPGSFVLAETREKTRTKSAAAWEPIRKGEPEMMTKTGLLSWLKQEFVRRLTNDRSALLDGQAAAADQGHRVDQRLSIIQERIEQQTDNYIRRIAELTRELDSAREENRELIRMRIAQVKADMEAARSNLLKESDRT